MKKFAVIDDEEHDCRTAVEALENVFPDCSVDVFHSITESLDNLDKYSLVILDVCFPNDVNGLEQLSRIVNASDYFLITSEYREYMEDAFGYKTVGFFKKGDGQSVLEKKLSDIARKYLDNIREIQTSIGKKEVMLDKVKYMEIVRRDVVVYCDDDIVFTLRGRSLKGAASELGNMAIVNRTQALNPAHVKSIHGQAAQLFSSEEFKCSRLGMRTLKNALIERLKP